MLTDQYSYVIGMTVLLLTGSPAMAANHTGSKVAAVDLADEQIVDEPLAQPADDVATANQKRAIEQYKQVVKDLESSGGVYQVQLSENLSSLGAAYQAINQHAEAIAVLERALHITRVNNGLYNIDQIAILEEIIESNTAMEDWENLSKNYSYLYWVNKRNYGDYDIKLLPIIDRIGRWHLQAFTSELDEQGFRHLLEADQLFERAIAIIELNHGENDPRLINALYGVALTNYQMAAVASNAEDFDDIRSSFRNRLSGGRRARQVLDQQFAEQELMLRNYAKGKKAMTRIVDIHAHDELLPPDMHAMALTHLGDWYLMFNKRNSAAKSYEEAYAIMNANGIEQEDIDRLFGQPRMLPAIQLPTQDEPVKNENPKYVIVAFNVSPTGRARNIEVIESFPSDDVSLQRKARKSVASAKFRPKFEGGKAVATEGLKIRYIFDE